MERDDEKAMPFGDLGDDPITDAMIKERTPTDPSAQRAQWEQELARLRGWKMASAAKLEKLRAQIDQFEAEGRGDSPNVMELKELLAEKVAIQQEYEGHIRKLRQKLSVN